MAETPSGMLNAIGLQGPGIDAFLERELPWLAQRGVKTVVSIAGGTVAEYTELARRLADAPGVTAVEVNLSCPNIEDRGRVFARDGSRRGRGDRLRALGHALRRAGGRQALPGRDRHRRASPARASTPAPTRCR